MVKKCPVYLHVSWLGTLSVEFKNKIKTSVEKYFFAVDIFTLHLVLSNVVYNFLCHATVIVGM